MTEREGDRLCLHTRAIECDAKRTRALDAYTQRRVRAGADEEGRAVTWVHEPRAVPVRTRRLIVAPVARRRRRMIADRFVANGTRRARALTAPCTQRERLA